MNRNGLYLRSIMAHLGLNRLDVAAVCGVSPRTVGNWLSDRNEIPGGAWPALAKVHNAIQHFARDVVAAWQEAGTPHLYNVTVPRWTLQGASYVAAWHALDALEAEHVFVTLKRPVMAAAE